MASDKKMLQIAAESALHNPSRSHDRRSMKLGAVGLRNDGVLVYSKNISTVDCFPHAHAEARLTKKLTKNSIVWVARVTSDGNWAMSRPCNNCENALRMTGVKKVVYTIGPNEWGVIHLEK
jgi:tRNA(Arg) A34 adenosine deaminase TadA